VHIQCTVAKSIKKLVNAKKPKKYSILGCIIKYMYCYLLKLNAIHIRMSSGSSFTIILKFKESDFSPFIMKKSEFNEI